MGNPVVHRALTIYPSSSLPPAQVCLPSGIVIDFASVISLDDIVRLAMRLGGRP